MGERAATELVERDYARQPLTPDEIETIFGRDEMLPFLNTRHAVFKDRGFASQLPPREELVSLIVAEPNLLRRPIVRKGRQVVVGFDRDAIRSLL